MNLDPRDTPVSAGSNAALSAYETALQQLQSYVGDPVQTIDAALEQEPDFLLGHLFRAGVLMTAAEKRFADYARPSMQQARALLGNAHDREQRLARAIGLLVDGELHRSAAAIDDVLMDYPRDVFALQVGHIFDFMRGDSLNLRNRVLRVLPHWSPAVPGYSCVMGMYAFGLEECNQYAEAEAAAQVALDIQPRDPWAVHAAAHVMEMQGRIDEGIRWLDGTAANWSEAGMMAVHNWWHLALFCLDRGQIERVLQLYDRNISEQSGDMILTMVDATALLWRLHVLGVDSGERMQRQADLWEARIGEEAGYYAFNDAHALMAFAAVGRDEATAKVLGALESAAASDSDAAAMAREVGLPAGRAIAAFGRGEYARVVEQLAPVRDLSARFGGSHAQRDVLSLTLIEAAIRAGRASHARHLLAERTAGKPSSALGWRLHSRAIAGASTK